MQRFSSTLIKQLTQTSTGKKPAEKILGDEWTLEKRIPDLASELIAYNEHQDQHGKLLEHAVVLFNEKPSNGIDFCL